MVLVCTGLLGEEGPVNISVVTKTLNRIPLSGEILFLLEFPSTSVSALVYNISQKSFNRIFSNF